MNSAQQSSAYLPPSSPTRSKVDSQREYREREQECINKLRYLIKKLTGEELRTRLEILRKAIDILSIMPGKGEAQVSAVSAYEVHPVNYVPSGAYHTMDNSIQSPPFSPNWPPALDFDAAFHDEQYNMLDMDSAPNQPGSQYDCGQYSYQR